MKRFTRRDRKALSTITDQISDLTSKAYAAGGYIDTGEIFECFDSWNDALISILDRHDDDTVTAAELIEILADYPGHATISAVETPAPGHVRLTIIRPTDGETRTDDIHREQNPPTGYAARWSTRR